MAPDVNNPGQFLAADIAEQPTVFARILARKAEISSLAKAVRQRHPQYVLFVARGSSEHAARYTKYLSEIVLGLPAGIASPAALTTYGAQPDFSNVLWVAISQGGSSPDIVESTVLARQFGAITLAVTNSPDSPLANASEITLDIAAGREKSVPATKSYTATLLALYLLVKALHNNGIASALALPDLSQSTMDSSTSLVSDFVQQYLSCQDLVVIGRGYSAVTAAETGLKLAETSYLFTRAYSGADLLHGPIAAIDQGTSVLAITSGNKGYSALAETLTALQQRKAEICAIGSAALHVAARHRISTPAIAEELTPILDILPVQQLALELALARGINPDHPRGLHKITQTH